MECGKLIVVACLGSSSTAGKGQAFDWIGELTRRPQNARLRMHNFGVGGDLANDALQRVPQVLAVRAARVIVWVGGNDALAMASDKARRLLRRMKSAPYPSAEGFADSLQKIVRALISAGTEVALCSLAPIGEAPNSDNPLQQSLNRHVEHFSAIIKATAAAEGLAYVAIFEALSAAIRLEPG